MKDSLLRTGKRIVQINLPKGEPGGLNPGEQVTVEVEPEEPRGEPKHGVFRLVRLLGVDGHLAKGDKQGIRHFSASIERLNYALHGEVDGAILHSGDFLRLIKPEGARAVKLKVGMQVAGHGYKKPMVGGHSIDRGGRGEWDQGHTQQGEKEAFREARQPLKLAGYILCCW